jgi:hypothetical protein
MKYWLRLVIRLALVANLSLVLLALTGSSTSQSAGLDQNLADSHIRYELNVIVKNPRRYRYRNGVYILCKDKTYRLTIKLLQRDVLGPEPFSPSRSPQTADVFVQKGSSIGNTLAPIDPRYNATTLAIYSYEARYTGNDEMEFYANIAEQLAPGTVKVKVVDCAHKVEMIYNGILPIEGTTFYWNGIMDEVTVEADENGQLHGTGTMVYSQTVSGLPGCSVSWSTLDMPATVSGAADDEWLHLNFAFASGGGTATTTCPIVGPMSGSMDSDPSPAFNAPISVPTNGGVVTYPSPAPGGGTVYVIVTPVEDDEAVSYRHAEDLLAVFAPWLDG